MSKNSPPGSDRSGNGRNSAMGLTEKTAAGMSSGERSSAHNETHPSRSATSSHRTARRSSDRCDDLSDAGDLDPGLLELIDQITWRLESGATVDEEAARRGAPGLGARHSQARAHAAGNGTGGRGYRRRPASGVARCARPGGPAGRGRLPHPSRDRPRRHGDRLRGRAGRAGPAGRLEGPAAGRGPRSAGDPAVSARGPGGRLAATPADRAGVRRRTSSTRFPTSPCN